MKPIFSIVFFLLMSITAFCQSPKFTLPQLLKIKKIEKAFTGSYDNQKQADTTKNKMLGHQKVRVLRVWKKQTPGEYWMYSGWFYGEDQSKPFQENLYQIIEMQGDTMVMQGYECTKSRQKGLIREDEWAKSDAFGKLTKDDLQLYCKFVIFPYQDGYRMESRPFVVKSEVEGTIFDRISFVLDRIGDQFILRNEYYLVGKDKPFIIPSGVLYEHLTSNPKNF